MSNPFGKKETDAELAAKIGHALHHGKSSEETALEGLISPIRQGLPSHWSSADGKTHLQGADVQIIRANSQDVQQYGFAPPRVCGTCKYYTVEHARKKMASEKFLHRLVNDEGWKSKFLGVPVDHVGLCGASDGSRATTSISNASACDQYRESATFARKRRVQI